MANIVRSDNGGQATPATPQAWDPFQMMRELFGWNPFHGVPSFAPARQVEAFSPDFEIKETKEGFVFKADLPGVQEKDLEIALTGNRLAIRGKREAEREEKADTFYAYERSYGSFSRAFTLPEGVDHANIAAELKDGVLTLKVPRVPETQPKKIEVQAQKK